MKYGKVRMVIFAPSVSAMKFWVNQDLRKEEEPG